MFGYNVNQCPFIYEKLSFNDKLNLKFKDLIFELTLKYASLPLNVNIGDIFSDGDIGLKYPLKGRIDDLFIDEDGELAGIEAKTSYGRGIVEIQKLNKPKQDDLNQVIVYMTCNPEIKRFYIVYFGRDNAYRTQFIIEQYDNLEHDFNNLIQRFYNLESYIDAKILPDREYQVAIKKGEIKKQFQKDKIIYKSMWCCMYCSYRRLCWKNQLIKYKDSDNSVDLHNYKRIAEEVV